MPHINILPAECLSRVFSFLHWNDLSNVTLTSKFFNDIVSTDSKLLQLVRFEYKPRSISVATESIRHYTRFHISGECDDSSLEFFMQINKERMENIHEILLGLFFTVRVENLMELFRKCKNLKRVEIWGSVGMYDRGYGYDMREGLGYRVIDCEKPNLNLDYLKIDTEYENLEFFEESSVRKLRIRRGIMKKLEKFLKTQEKLESLELEHFNDFSSLILDEYKFKLTELSLKDCEATPTLLELLKKHEKTLKVVILRGLVTSNLINILFGLKNLTLKINFIMTPYKVIEPLKVMSNVTSLLISCDHNDVDYANFDGKFPNAKKVRLIDFKSLFKPLTKFENCEEFTLEKCTMKTPLAIPNVKKLKFSHVTFQMIRNPFDFKENSLEVIQLENCFFFAWFYQFLDLEDTRLKYTRLNQSRKDIKKDVLERNEHKVGKIRIYHYFSL